MRCSLAQFAICFVGFVVLSAVTGCRSMNGYVMNSSGQAFYEQGNYAMAAAEFEKAVASAPHNPDYTSNLAKTRYKMGDVSGAELVYRRNLATSPDHQPSWHGLAELMVAHGRGEEAASMLSQWVMTHPHVAEPHLELAWLHRQLGQQEAAAQSLQQALRVNPGHPQALAHLGQYYQDSGQMDQAIAMYQQSLQSDWNQPQVHSKLSSAVASAGPGHPVNAVAMSRGAGPQGFQPHLAARPGAPFQMAQSMAPFGQPVSPGPQISEPYPPRTPFAPGPHFNHPQSGQMPVAATQQNAGPVAGVNTSGIVPATHSNAMGLGFGFPTAAASPVTSIPAQHAVVTPPQSHIQDPIPDPSFGQPAVDSVPITSLSSQSLFSPDETAPLPEVEAF
ncbi:MAG: tetratricopeptide repeat protein [Fuerstiella sp.]|nr:tetratricopeptide repeat protein [Fuerstiella sp.]